MPTTPKKSAATRRPVSKTRTTRTPAASPARPLSPMDEIRKQRTRKLALQADKMERELALAAGEVLPKALIQEEIISANTTIRKTLALLYKTLPAQLAGLDEPAMGEVIKETVTRILDRLCKTFDAAPP